MKKTFLLLCVMLFCLTSCKSSEANNINSVKEQTQNSVIQDGDASNQVQSASKQDDINSKTQSQNVIKKKDIEAVEKIFQNAQKSTESKLKQEDIYYPPILIENNKISKIKIDFGTEGEGESEKNNVFISFFDVGYTEKDLKEKLKIKDYKIQSISVNQMNDGQLYGKPMQHYFDAMGETKYASDGKKYAVWSFYINEPDELGNKRSELAFNMVYELTDKSFVGIIGSIPSSGPMEMTEELEKQIYNDFQVVSLDNLKNSATS